MVRGAHTPVDRAAQEEASAVMDRADLACQVFFSHPLSRPSLGTSRHFPSVGQHDTESGPLLLLVNPTKGVCHERI